MKTSFILKFTASALFFVLLSAFGARGGDSHTAFMVGNTRQGFVCVEDVVFFGSTATEAAQIILNLLAFYGVADPLAGVPIFISNTVCGDTDLLAPPPNLIIHTDYYRNVVSPADR
jgi:hypothetical protein